MQSAQTAARMITLLKSRWIAVFLMSFALGVGTAQASPIGDLVDIDFSGSGMETVSGFSFALDTLDLDQVLVSDTMAEVENQVLDADAGILELPGVELTVDVNESTVDVSFQNISGFPALLSGSFWVRDLDWLNNGIPVAGQITNATINRMDMTLNWGSDFVGYNFSDLTVANNATVSATITFTTEHTPTTEPPPAPIPEPSTIFLFGSGLAGLAAWRYRKTVKA